MKPGPTVVTLQVPAHFKPPVGKRGGASRKHQCTSVGPISPRNKSRANKFPFVPTHTKPLGISLIENILQLACRPWHAVTRYACMRKLVPTCSFCRIGIVRTEDENIYITPCSSALNSPPAHCHLYCTIHLQHTSHTRGACTCSSWNTCNMKALSVTYV
jgi:hypothetical protein